MQGEISFIISSPEGPWIFSMYQIKKKWMHYCHMQNVLPNFYWIVLPYVFCLKNLHLGQNLRNLLEINPAGHFIV